MPSVLTIGSSRVHLPETLVASYNEEARRLRDLGRIDEAEAVLREAIKSAPDDTELLVDYARLAERRGDFAEAAGRWAGLRSVAPHHSLGFIAGAQALREAGQFDDAEALLRDAMQRFPDGAGPVIEHAWLAHVRRDWAEAGSRWEGVRCRFADRPVGYTAGAVALREQRRLEEAEQLLADAMERFPTERAPFAEYAWLATACRDWPTAARRWEEIRRRYPESPEGYVRGAQALSEMWQYAEAEALLADGMTRLPQDDGLACEHAWAAFHRHEFDEAARRFEGVRSRFADCLTGYTGGALALRNLFRLRDAELLLEEAQNRFPNEPRVLFEHAQLPMFHPLRRDRDPDEALRRLSLLREAFPEFEEGYVQALRYLREGGRFDEADALAQSGLRRLPRSVALAVEYGNNARERGDWDESIRRFETAMNEFPTDAGAAIGLAASLSMAGRHDAAEQLLQGAIERFPHNPVVFNEHAQLAARQNRWEEALARWSEAQRRFPDQRDLEHRIFEARLRLTEREGGEDSAAEAGDPGEVAAMEPVSANDDPRAATRELVMQFESLGGTGLGCEFGMFQREFGAEPLGLLRWADMPYDGLIFCLESRFEGVGSEEHTELFINRENSRPEYCTVDRRGFMFMRAFVYEDEMPFERMWQQVLRRIGYLKDKLIRDLEDASKIFIYRITNRNLSEEELARLHAAVRSYGDNTLLYVRYADAAHPNGTVEITAPGLMIGYMDRFKLMPDGQLYASPPSASWLEICRNAHALWSGQRKEAPGPTPVKQPALPAPESASGRSSGFDGPKTGALDVLGILAGTDKTSLGNDYLHFYESIFEPLGIRDKTFDLIEIGVAKGKSLKLWETYFPNARIIGVDIDQDCRKFSGGNVIIEVGSQADREFLSQLATRYRPYIIIDDGSHIAQHIQFTFETLYPSLMPGGYYIIEDTYMHFGPSAAAHLGDTTISFGDYFSDLALSKIRQWIEGDGASKDFKNYWFSSTESISFAKSIIAIHKKPAVLSAKEAIAIVDQYCATEAGTSPDALFGAAGVILAHDGLPERAEALMRKAIAEKPEAPEFHNRISEIFSRQGRFAAAIASLSRATQLGPQDPFYWDRLARLYARIGDHERASDSMKKALELFPNPHCYHFLSETLRNQGLIGEAVHALTQAVELARKTPMADIWEGELQSLTAQERSVRASDTALT